MGIKVPRAPRPGDVDRFVEGTTRIQRLVRTREDGRKTVSLLPAAALLAVCGALMAAAACAVAWAPDALPLRIVFTFLWGEGS